MATLGALTAVNMVSGDFLDLEFDSLVAVSSTQVAVDYGDGTRGVFIGSGITFTGAVPIVDITGGMVSRIEIQNTSGDLLYFADGLSLSAATVETQVLTNDGAGLLAMVIAGNDSMTGSAFADLVTAGSGNDTVDAGGGADIGYGQSGGDVIDGGADNDLLRGNSGDDSIVGGLGGDTLRGQSGNDTLTGGDGADALFGGGNDDSVRGDAGSDVINGDSGLDMVFGGDGNDTVRGQGAADTVSGGAGNDLMLGHAGADSMTGGDDNDTMTGGPANDTLTGNAGSDFFQFGLSHAADTVTDFEPGVDKLSLVTGSIGVDQFGDLTIVDTAAGARLTFEATPSTVITLTGVDAADLDAGDVFFS